MYESEEPGLAVLYLAAPDGSLITMRYSDKRPPLPEGARQITEEEFGTALIAMDAMRNDHLGQVESEEKARQLADYTALRDVKLPEDLSRRLSGYTGDGAADNAEAGAGRG